MKRNNKIQYSNTNRNTDWLLQLSSAHLGQQDDVDWREQENTEEQNNSCVCECVYVCVCGTVNNSSSVSPSLCIFLALEMRFHTHVQTPR